MLTPVNKLSILCKDPMNRKKVHPDHELFLLRDCLLFRGIGEVMNLSRFVQHWIQTSGTECPSGDGFGHRLYPLAG